jgi:hypothetical protein
MGSKVPYIIPTVNMGRIILLIMLRNKMAAGMIAYTTKFFSESFYLQLQGFFNNYKISVIPSKY